jgi:hypothetical protein
MFEPSSTPSIQIPNQALSFQFEKERAEVDSLRAPVDLGTQTPPGPRRAARALQYGESLLRKYEAELLLGEGVSSSVISASKKSDGSMVAIKIIRKVQLFFLF